MSNGYPRNNERNDTYKNRINVSSDLVYIIVLPCQSLSVIHLTDVTLAVNYTNLCMFMMPKRAFVKILQSILQKHLTQWSILPMAIFSRCLCKVHCRCSGCFIFFLVYIILIYVIQIYNLCKVHCRYGSRSSHNLSHRCNGLPHVCKGGQSCT